MPDINDFTRGLSLLLSKDGVVTIEFQHLLTLIKYVQFDTIYHEHYSYLSVGTTKKILNKFGLRIFDVEKLKTHGGSVRIYACREDAKHITRDTVDFTIQEEKNARLFDVSSFKGFQEKAEKIKDSFVNFLKEANAAKKKVCGYGAAAKGNTLINFSEVGRDLLPFVSDASKSKIGKYLPGSRIPILEPTAVIDFEPDYLIIFPWNIGDEIKKQFQVLQNTGCKFISFIPQLREL